MEKLEDILKNFTEPGVEHLILTHFNDTFFTRNFKSYQDYLKFCRLVTESLPGYKGKKHSYLLMGV